MRRLLAGCAVVGMIVGTAAEAARAEAGKPSRDARDATVVVTVSAEVREKDTDDAPEPFEGDRATVDVALLLDTSNSMDGLINQAKSQLWTIVQQFAEAKKAGKTPLLRVALFEYGNTRLPATEGYLRQVVPLTDDLDSLSEALFGLSTSGGDEYCGQVIEESLKRLDWSKEPDGYKAIFIAGNEPFTQGPVDYRKAVGVAIGRGVIVNTIHCGREAEGVSGEWRAAALLAEGRSFNIDQDRAVVQIPCPQDKRILELNIQLNRTYLWYGAKPQREKYGVNQRAQDANAESLGQSTAASRAITKGGAAYSNLGRCVVDTFLVDESILDKIKPEELPDALKDLTPEERKAHVQELAAERKALQAEIGRLAKARDAFLKAERARRAEAGSDDTLGAAVSEAVAEQLQRSGFERE